MLWLLGIWLLELFQGRVALFGIEDATESFITSPLCSSEDAGVSTEHLRFRLAIKIESNSSYPAVSLSVSRIHYTHTNTHSQRKRLPRDGANISHGINNKCKTTFIPLIVCAAVFYSFAMICACDSRNMHYDCIPIWDVYVSYLPTEPLQGEGRRARWLMEYSWMAFQGHKG